MTEICTFDEIRPGDGEAVGGKALSLSELTRAGLPVPPGFCITTAAHRRLHGDSPASDQNLRTAIVAAYRQLGAGVVAVRSSATAEDSAAASFAGQQETLLGISGETELLNAVARCWDSLDAERARAYRQLQGVGDNGLAMAVVVQRLVPAEVAGVLFTRDPHDPEGRLMRVEAAWGLGETVVSGQVMPDSFRIDRDTGAIRERHISTKTVCRTPTGPEPVPVALQDQPCLDETQIVGLAALGREVEKFYGEPRDIEWAWAGGRFWLLQARPITTADAAEREQVRREEIAALRQRAEPGGTVWSFYNLSETLAAPTPMTWAIVRRFMSARGGYGLMYRDLGYRPDSSLDDSGAYDLVCGRPYCNLSREPRFYPSWLPHEHSFARLRQYPERAFYPQAVANPARAGALFWAFLPFRLPFIFFRSVAFAARLGNRHRTFAEHFRSEILPRFAREVDQGRAEDLSALAPPALLERLEFWIHRTLCDFARDSLKPTFLAYFARGNLERWLGQALGPERTQAALGELTLGVHPDPEADFPAALQELAVGRLDRQTFLDRFGHRGPEEMELARPRWAEDPGGIDLRFAIDDLRLKDSHPDHIEQPTGDEGQPASSIANRRSQIANIPDVWSRIADEARLSSMKRALLEPEVEALRNYTALRETAKHHLMRGYALIRRILLGLDRRFNLGGGIFFLTPEDLPRLITGEDLSGLIAQRRRRRNAALALEVPRVLFSDDLEAIGRPVPPPSGDHLRGVPLSAGVTEGPALVLREPTGGCTGGVSEDYILVCPSTDPAWVPLFLRAKGLVMETGGVLSHGAIVAREFGLPAVAGLPGITAQIKTGQRLRVDGASGLVTVLS
jgi:rifampicin phosphotransferase